MSDIKTVAVIGGGLGGLAAAAALVKFGFEVQVYERSAKLRELGAGINISPQATKALAELGLGDGLAEVGNPLLVQSLRSVSTGDLVAAMDLRPAVEFSGSPYYLFHRGDLLDVLARGVGLDNIHLSHKCVSISEGPLKVSVAFDNGRSIEADVVIGADGIYSQVRRYLYGNYLPRYTGQMLWRALIDGNSVPSDVLGPYGFYGWVGEGSHLMTYYLRGTKTICVVSQVDTSDVFDESLLAEVTPEGMRARIPNACPDLAALLNAVTECSPWPFFAREPSDEWGRGRIQLIGDAAHPMLPNAGQGASQTFEDAYILARWMDACRSDYATAFESFRRVRMPRVHAVQTQSAANAKTFHNGRWQPISTAAAAPTAKSLSALGLDWIYNYDVVDEWKNVPAGPLLNAV